MTPFKQVLLGFCKKEMIEHLESNPQDFAEAIELALISDQPYSWRSAWLLWDVMQENDVRVRKHLKRIIEAIPTKRDGQQRDLLRIVSFMKLDEEDEGNLYETCIKIWLSISHQPSARYRALLTMFQIADKYSDLKNELKSITSEEYIETLSPGIKSAAKKIILML